MSFFYQKKYEKFKSKQKRLEADKSINQSHISYLNRVKKIAANDLTVLFFISLFTKYSRSIFFLFHDATNLIILQSNFIIFVLQCENLAKLQACNRPVSCLMAKEIVACRS